MYNMYNVLKLFHLTFFSENFNNNDNFDFAGFWWAVVELSWDNHEPHYWHMALSSFILLGETKQVWEEYLHRKNFLNIWGFVAIVDHITHFYWSGIAKRKKKASLDNFKESKKNLSLKWGNFYCTHFLVLLLLRNKISSPIYSPWSFTKIVSKAMKKKNLSKTWS